MAYDVEIAPAAKRQIKKLSKPIQKLIVERLEELFYCRKCQRYSTEKLDFIDSMRSHTQRYEENIYERVLVLNR